MSLLSINIREEYQPATDRHRWRWEILSGKKVLAVSEDDYPNSDSAFNGLDSIMAGIGEATVTTEPCAHNHEKPLIIQPEGKSDIHKARKDIRHGRRDH